MTVRTHLDLATGLVRKEHEATESKRQAFDRFSDRVAEIQATMPTEGSLPSLSGGWTGAGSNPSTDGCRAVRRTFAELVEPHSTADIDGSETVHRTIASELSREVAMSLATEGSGGAFTPRLKNAVVEQTDRRVAECTAMERALDRETDQLSRALETIRPMLDWFVESEGSSLLNLGFDELADRHRRLDGFRESCTGITESRQEFLRGASSGKLSAGIRHAVLVEYLYADLPVDHPVLATVCRLDGLCADTQYAIRDHLVRRV